MQTSFDFFCHSPTVTFGAGRANQVRKRLRELGRSRALVVTTASGKRRYASVIESMADAAHTIFADAQPHCPIDVANAALDAYLRAGCDSVVSIGGGSTIGLGKYISVEAGAPHIALPTTLSGSELTPLFGVLVHGEKRSRREPKALANTVIVDPVLAQSLPIHETATTGMNALAHCIEALYVPQSNPLTSQLALTGIDMLYRGFDASGERPRRSGRQDSGSIRRDDRWFDGQFGWHRHASQDLSRTGRPFPGPARRIQRRRAATRRGV